MIRCAKPLHYFACKAVLLIALIVCPSTHTIAQTPSVPGRITQAVDEQRLVPLAGNTYPLAHPEFDQGRVFDAQPLRRMLLVLQRSPEQEAALQKLLSEQQDTPSPNYHAWLTPEQFGKQF